MLLWETRPLLQREQVEAVTINIGAACIDAAFTKALQDDVVHVKSSIAAHLNKAVDQARRGDNKLLRS